MKRKRKPKVQNEICDASARARVPPNPLFQVLAIKVGHPLSVEWIKKWSLRFVETAKTVRNRAP